MKRATLLLAALSATCLSEPGENSRVGTVDPAASEVEQVVVAWMQGLFDFRMVQIPDPLIVDEGRVAVTDGTFDLDALTDELAGPDQLPDTCMSGDGLSLGLLIGAGPEAPDDVNLLAFPAGLPAFSDEVLAVWSEDPILAGTEDWQAFETVIPEGASLCRHVQCRAWRKNRCRPFALLKINCLEPLPSDAVVVLNPP